MAAVHLQAALLCSSLLYGLLCGLLCGLHPGLLRSAHADESPPHPDLSRPLSLADCLRLADTSAVPVLAARARRLDADAGVAQAATLPNPSFSYVAQDLGLTTAAGPLLLHQAMIGLAPGTALLRIQESRAARLARTGAEATVASERRTLRLAVGLAFYDLGFLHRLADVEQRALRLTAAYVAQAQLRQAHGDASGLDTQRAQAEHIDAQRQAESTNQERLRSELWFSIALGAERPQPLQLIFNPDVSNDVSNDVSSNVSNDVSKDWAAGASAALAGLPPLPESLTADNAERLLDDLFRLAREHRPELRQAMADAEQALALGRLAVLRALPLSDAQLALGLRQSAVGTSGVLAVSGSLPLWDFAGGPRLRAQAQGLAARARMLDHERQIRLELATALHDLQTLRTQRRQHALPLRELRSQILKTVRLQFAEGVVPFFDVVQAHRDLLAAERALAAVERDAQKARFRLVAAIAAW